MKKCLAWIVLFALLLSLAACSPKKDQTLKIGFVPFQDAEHMVESMEPLEAALGKELGIPVKAFVASNYVGMVTGLASESVDFAFIPPFAYVLAQREAGVQVGLVARNKKGQCGYTSSIYVPKDSSIQDLKDLKGKRIGIVDMSSSSGYIFPIAMLKKAGLDPEKDLTLVTTGGHDKSIQALLNGDIDAAAVFTGAPERYEKDFPEAKENLRILKETDVIPGVAVVFRKGMENGERAQIEAALLKLVQDPEVGPTFADLFSIYGFEKTSEKEYEVVKEAADLLNIDLSQQK